MIEETNAKKLLTELAFTNKEVAEFVGITESMVKKIRTGSSSGSADVQQKIEAFVCMKIEKVKKKIKTSSLFSFDVV